VLGTRSTTANGQIPPASAISPQPVSLLTLTLPLPLLLPPPDGGWRLLVHIYLVCQACSAGLNEFPI